MRRSRQRVGRRRASVPLAACLAAVTLAACGGGQGDAVVRVNGAPISKAQVEHWMSAVAASASTNPGQPKFQTPKPPDYRACIAYLEKYPTFGLTVETTRPARKAKCEFEYEKEKLKAVYDLVSFDWVSGEAAELGVKLSATELSKALASFAHQPFPNGESLREYLASQGETSADLSMFVKQELLVAAVHRMLEAQLTMRRLTVQQRQRALTSFGEAYVRKWRQRTDCQAGYVEPICRQYRAPRTPPKLVPNAIPLTDLAAE